ncbi:hypothetical protein GGI43DRAFT_415108 [Trichoderma evansii]
MPALKRHPKRGRSSRVISLPSRYSFIPNQVGKDFVLINAAEFTYEYFKLLINNKPKRAYKEFHKLKVAYDEYQMRCAEIQAKYAADLNHKNQKIADLEMKLEEMERSRNQGATISRRILHDTSSSGVIQSGGTYGGSITTSSGHVRQGNNYTDIRNQLPFNLIFHANANVEIQVYTPTN